LKGSILLTLIGSAHTTTEISYRVGEPIGEVRNQLIRMHHLNLVEPIGVRCEDGGEEPPARGLSYYDDLLWSVTDHTRDHNEYVEGCRGCALRDLIPGIAAVGLVE
jgi:hypothetical protein